MQISNNNFNQRCAIPRVITIDNENCTIKGWVPFLPSLTKRISKYKITIYYKGNKIRENCWIDYGYDEIWISFSRWKKNEAILQKNGVYRKEDYDYPFKIDLDYGPQWWNKKIYYLRFPLLSHRPECIEDSINDAVKKYQSILKECGY